MNPQQLIDRATEIVASIPIGQRHAIVVEHNDDEIVPLAYAVSVAACGGQLANVKLICEALFALGYLAGKDDRIDLGAFGEGE